MRRGLILAALALAGCGSETPSQSNDKILEEAIALEKKTNAAVNATIADIERQGLEALNAQRPEADTNMISRKSGD